jgi:hypothetical protein
MDEDGIAGGADFTDAIGEAIEASSAVVAVIDAKFAKSTYCFNELVMAQGRKCQIFPIMFREMTFDDFPSELTYMLASTNCIPFPDEASDEDRIAKMIGQMQSSMATLATSAQAAVGGGGSVSVGDGNDGDGSGGHGGGGASGSGGSSSSSSSSNAAHSSTSEPAALVDDQAPPGSSSSGSPTTAGKKRGRSPTPTRGGGGGGEEEGSQAGGGGGKQQKDGTN